MAAADKEAAIKKFVEAEPLLLAGYQGMKAREASIPQGAQARLDEALQYLVALYKAWGKPDEAARWQTELDKRQEKPKAKPGQDHKPAKTTDTAKPASPAKTTAPTKDGKSLKQAKPTDSTNPTKTAPQKENKPES